MKTLKILTMMCLCSSTAYANDCSFIGGQFERLYGPADMTAQSREISNLNLQIKTLINICGGNGNITDIPSQNVELTNLGVVADPNKSACDASTISSQATSAINVISSNKGAVSAQISTLSSNVDELTKLLLTCNK